MPKKQKRPARFDFKPFSKQQRRLIHWWRPAVRVGRNDFVIADGAVHACGTKAEILPRLLNVQMGCRYTKEATGA